MNVFVYGTLRKHEKYHQLLEGATLIAEQAWVDGHLYDTNRGYPALKEGTNKVYGEVYSINGEILKRLDKLEDFVEGCNDNLYDRKIKEVKTDSKRVQAFVYYGIDSSMFQKEIKSNDWKIHRFITEKPEVVYYFAYGSCMDQERFQKAKVDHLFQKRVGASVLKNYTMKYLFVVQDGGRGDIEEDGGSMEGILYETPYEAVEYLFKREGVTPGWYRPAFVDVEVNGHEYQNVLTFIVRDKQEETLPPKHYAREILRGSQPYVSIGYHNKLRQQLIQLGYKPEEVEELLK